MFNPHIRCLIQYMYSWLYSEILHYVCILLHSKKSKSNLFCTQIMISKHGSWNTIRPTVLHNRLLVNHRSECLYNMRGWEQFTRKLSRYHTFISCMAINIVKHNFYYARCVFEFLPYKILYTHHIANIFRVLCDSDIHLIPR